MDKRSEVIRLLKEDARFTSKQISNILNCTDEEISGIIRELEQSGVIVKYRTVVNNEKLDENYVEALVEIKVNPQRAKGYDHIAEMLVQFDEIKSLYLFSGGFDFAMFVEGKSIKEVAFFVNERLSVLDCVSSTTTNFVLKKYKSEGMPLFKAEDPERQELF